MKGKVIGRLYRHVLKHILFLFPPETMHTTFGNFGKALGSTSIGKRITHVSFYYEHPSLKQNLFNITFPNPVGLSAGFDKDILLPDIVGDIGFGREECGSITFRSYTGNVGTRLYRLKKSKGLVVNYGLKNNGVEYTKEMIEKSDCKVPLFVSLAKTNCLETCDLKVGIDDYVSSLKALQGVQKIQGFVLNISCPNAFGGEDYTTPDRLAMLLEAIATVGAKQPIFVKLPVDKSWEETKELVGICIQWHIQGVIIANLTKQRQNIIEKDEIANISGGISGKPTQEKSDYLIGQTYKAFGKNILIVGVGGIFSAEDAYRKIKLGASLVGLITGMIFQGPQLIGEINKGIVDLMKKDGYQHISEAVGKGSI